MRCRDGENVLIAGIMEHIEEAGVHSGDSVPACCLRSRFRRQTSRNDQDVHDELALALNVIGLMNVQYAIKDGNGLRAGSESARLAHGSLRQQGHRRSAAEDRRRPDAWQEADGLRDLTGGVTSGVLPVPQFFVKSPGVPVQQISRV